MLVIAYDPYVSKEEMLHECGTESVDSLEALLERADFVSLHTPLTKGTQNLISDSEFAKMKKGSYLINCGRGALVDEKALIEAIESGLIAGAGLDVLQQEPPTPDNPILKCPNIVFSPHCAAHTVRALSVLRGTAISSILQALRGLWPDNVVNPEVREVWCSRFGKEQQK
jgi:D-3-phosphoglycerate dehydrogenase